MEIFWVYVMYLWVSVIHSIFTGITSFALWGNKLSKWPAWITILLFFCFLGFLEIYWIPFFRYFGLTVYSSNEVLHSHYGFNGKTNIVDLLAPKVMNAIVWLLEALFAYYIGKRTYTKIISSVK